jgi:hypothetical protein
VKRAVGTWVNSRDSPGPVPIGPRTRRYLQSPRELLRGYALHRIDEDFRFVQEYDVAGIHFTNTALRPLLGDFPLDLYVDVIALKAEGISFTPSHLFVERIISKGTGGGGGAFFNSSLLANQMIPSGFSPRK